MEKPSNKERFKRIRERLFAHITLNLDDFSELHNFIENEIKIRQENIQKLYDEIDDLDDPIEDWMEKIKIFENNDELNMYRFDHAFPNRTRFFILIQIHVIVEFYIKWLCEEVRKLTENKFSINDLKGNAELEKSKIYLTKIFEINFKFLEPEWTFLNNMRKLRNQIVHKNGLFSQKDAEILKIINENNNLGILWDDIQSSWKIDEEREIKIGNKKLIESYISNTKTFFNKLCDRIDEKL